MHDGQRRHASTEELKRATARGGKRYRSNGSIGRVCVRARACVQIEENNLTSEAVTGLYNTYLHKYMHTAGRIRVCAAATLLLMLISHLALGGKRRRHACTHTYNNAPSKCTCLKRFSFSFTALLPFSRGRHHNMLLSALEYCSVRHGYVQ